MKKLIMILLVMLTASSFAQNPYNIGDTVLAEDNINWTISGPAGHAEVGKSSNIFDMVATGKPVMIFIGGFG